MSHLFATDRKLITSWFMHGIPDNKSTRDYAAELLTRLLDAHDELHDMVDQLANKAADDRRAIRELEDELSSAYGAIDDAELADLENWIREQENR